MPRDLLADSGPRDLLADAEPKKIDSTPEELTFGEKAVSLLPDFVQNVLGNAAGGNIRGSAVGRVAMGMADPGVALTQIAANAAGQGRTVNDVIKRAEERYQTARAGKGSTGFDPLRMAGNVAITAPLAGIGAAGAGAGTAATIGRGALQGAGFAALEPVSNGGDNFVMDKLKQVGTGAAVGGVTAPILGALGRVISPDASKNKSLQLLQEEGVTPSIGQAAGGVLGRMEEKAQSVPFLGDAIRGARQAGREGVEDAAYARAADPINETIKARGTEGVKELQDKLGKAYEEVIPKLSVDALDPAFVGRLANLRSMAQSLPAEEARQFDNIISREIDQRLAPNGMLSGQNLKDAWNALRDESALFLKSDNAYEKKLGGALKQTFQELKDHVTNTNPKDVVDALRGADLGYANFKRIQKAAGSVGAPEGRFTPAQLDSAVKSADFSKDRGGFSNGDALMSDLSRPARALLGDNVPNSGTIDRLMSGSVAGLAVGGALSPLALAYTKPVQNALVAILTKRGATAPQIQNYLRQYTPAAISGAVPLALQDTQR